MSRLGPRALVGGIVSYRDGPRVAAAVASLLAQDLPEGWAWRRIWVVVSPDDLGTVAYARAAAGEDPRITVIEEVARAGKSSAMAEIFRHADGDLLVLLNGDAVAEAGAVHALIQATDGAPAVFGVMARPVPPPARGSLFGESLELLWGLHDVFHEELGERNSTGHLSDELFALPIARLPPFQPGIITDGAFAATWIRSQGGEIRYARNSLVRVALPARVRDHLEQRRRIKVGHCQVLEMTGRTTPTLASLAKANPARAIRLIRAEARQHTRGWASLAALVAIEVLATVLARWDVLRRRKGYGVWPRVALAEVDPHSESTPAGVPG